MITVGEFIKRFEAYCPKSLAYGKDPIGLHFGNSNQPVKKIMVTLDIRPEVVEEAIYKKVDLIMAHHPPIFRPITSFDTGVPQQKMYADLIKHDIAVYAAHTNLDIVSDGLNDWLAEALWLQQTQVLSPTGKLSYKKIVVFVPITHTKQVQQAMFHAGAGQIGTNYHECSFKVKGVGEFTPIETANPVIGSVGTHEEVEEERLEMICREDLLSSVLAALRQAHPYEVPAYDVFTVENITETVGFGRVGELDSAMTLQAFLQQVQQAFQVQGLRYVVPKSMTLDTLVKRIAVCGGAGDDFYRDALAAGADVYVTGDVYFHTAHDIQAAGLTVIDPGHHIEKICVPKLIDKITTWAEELSWDVEVIASEIDTEPFCFFVAGEQQ